MPLYFSQKYFFQKLVTGYLSGTNVTKKFQIKYKFPFQILANWPIICFVRHIVQF